MLPQKSKSVLASDQAAAIPKALVFPVDAVVVGERLGAGAYGEVRAGTLCGLPICVKVLVHSLRVTLSCSRSR